MYYLHHYFNPDFSHMKLSPLEKTDGSVDYHYLGYVQNVVAGQILAEILPLEDVPEGKRDPRFIYSKKYLPCGPNCTPHPENPDKLIAACNGYCFYYNSLISVKKLLNVRGNLGFHTGNIFFVGDIAVHGDVQTGFAVFGQNLLVKGHIESAKVKATGNIVTLSGVKGTNTSSMEAADVAPLDLEVSPENAGKPVVPTALLDAGGTIRLPFCEHVQIRAKGNVIIDGSCLHSTLYVGGNLVIKGRLQGGSVYANGIVYVEGQLGSDYTSTTRIFMGYDPFDFLLLQKLESQIFTLKDKAAYFEKQAQRNQVMELEFAPRFELAQRKLKIAFSRRNALWHKLSMDEEHARRCRVIVPGKIMPGCEISIAQAYLKTFEQQSDTSFSLVEDEIVSQRPAVLHENIGLKLS